MLQEAPFLSSQAAGNTPASVCVEQIFGVDLTAFCGHFVSTLMWVSETEAVDELGDGQQTQRLACFLFHRHGRRRRRRWVSVQVRMRSRTDVLPGVCWRSGRNIVEGKKGGRISRFRPGRGVVAMTMTLV